MRSQQGPAEKHTYHRTGASFSFSDLLSALFHSPL